MMTFSSHVSHVPHGVGPPAQLRTVPEIPTHSPVRLPRPSVVSTVQPPALTAPASYTVPSMCGTPNAAAFGVSSWFWMSVMLRRSAATTAVPSWKSGVLPWPNERSVSPTLLAIVYAKPAGRARMPAGSSTSGGNGRPPDGPPWLDGNEAGAAARATPRLGNVPATARPTPAAPPVRI